MILKRLLTACLAAAMALGSLAPAIAAREQTLSLGDVQRMALEYHPNLRVVEFDSKAAEEAINIARSVYSPQVEGTAVSAFTAPGTRIAAIPDGINDPTVLQRTSAGVEINQYITDFGHTSYLVRSYELASKAELERGQETRLVVLLNATQAYFEVLRARALLRLAQQTYIERRTFLRQISTLQKAGLRSTLDVSVAQRDLSSANQEIVVARAQVQDAYATLSDAMGSPDNQRYRLQKVRALPAIPKAVGPLLDETLAENPALSAMNTDVAADIARQHSVARETSPTISAYGYVGGSPIRAANQELQAAYETAGVALNVPIFTGGRLAAARRQAEDTVQADTASVETERNSLLKDTRVAYNDVVASRDNITATEQIVHTAQTALALTSAQYRIGLSNIVDLSEAELQLTQAQIDHTNAIYNYMEQGAGLDFVTGALSPST